jgi:Spy/CpxP family protein refolding chaperone
LLLTANIITLALLWTTKNKDRSNMRPPPPGGQVFEFLTKELKLDEQQQEAYKKLRDEHQQARRGIQDSIRSAKDEFFALLKKPDVSDSVIHVYSGRAVAADQQLDEFTFRHFQKLRAICNAEQQKKFDDIIQEALRRMAPAKRRGPPPGMNDPERRPPPPAEKE